MWFFMRLSVNGANWGRGTRQTHKQSDKDKLQVPMRKEMCDLHGREAEKLGISDFLLVSI